jgi:hypothetical protein
MRLQITKAEHVMKDNRQTKSVQKYTQVGRGREGKKWRTKFRLKSKLERYIKLSIIVVSTA